MNTPVVTSSTYARSLLEASLDPLVTISAEGKITDVNAATEKVTGVARAHLIDSDFADYFTEPEQARAGYLQVFSQGTVTDYPLAIHHVSGKITDVLYNASVYRDADGLVLGVFAAARDITERKRAEQANQAAAQYARSLLEVSLDPLVTISAQGKITDVNQATEQVTGVDRSQLIGSDFADYFTEPELARAGYREVFLKESVTDYPLAIRHVSGKVTDVLYNASVYRDADGVVLGVFAAARDITERKRMEVALQQARDAADAANLAKSAFLANMSHEIRTPLNAIIGLNHLLRRDGATPQQLKRLELVDSAGRHLLAIINDILDISKIEAGRMRLEDTSFHLSATLDNVASIFGDAARTKGIKLHLDTDSVPMWLRGDPMRLRQALINYTGNAIKFTEQGDIWLRAMLLQDDGDKLLVRFEVQDSGIGIAPEKISCLFKTFEQGDVSTTRKYGGTGLGLAITQRLVQLMSGEVGVDSTPGLGSTFWFTAALRHGQGSMPALSTVETVDAETQLRLHHRGARILLAEDNATNRDVAVELLTGAGFAVDTALDGLQAVQMAQGHVYDLILMDLQMPNMDGLEATLAIRTLPGWATKPIVAMTANAFEEDRLACEEAGMSDFVAKPVDPGLLFTTLLKWFPILPGKAPLDSDIPIRHEPNARSPGPSTASTCQDVALVPTLASLDKVQGLNLDYGLAVMRGQADKYIAVLGRFVASHGDDMRVLAVQLANGEHARAQLLTHTLKGAAATLGADQLAERAARLEKWLRTHKRDNQLDDACQADMAAITLEFDALAAALPKAQSDAAPGATVADLTELRDLAKQLDTLLGQGDARAAGFLEQHASALQAALGAEFDTLAQQIRAFDFEAALQTVRSSKR